MIRCKIGGDGQRLISNGTYCVVLAMRLPTLDAISVVGDTRCNGYGIFHDLKGYRAYEVMWDFMIIHSLFYFCKKLMKI